MALGVAVIDVSLRKLGWIGEWPARIVLAAAAAGVVLAAGVGWAWRLPRWAGARALDRFHGLHDRLANGLSFSSLAPAERTPLMEAAIEDAIEASASVLPARAVPIRAPRSLGWAGAWGAVLCAIMMFEVRARVAAPRSPTIQPLEMSADDLDDVKEFLKREAEKSGEVDVRATIEEFNQLVDDIASKRVDREETFRRMEALEQKLVTETAAERKALDETLAGMGEELKRADLTHPVGAALSDRQLDKARDAMREAANKARREARGPVDAAKLEAVRDALKKAAERAEKNQALRAERRQQLADEILKAKEKLGDGGSDEEQSLLKKKERELERLDRDLDAQRGASQQLDRLDRELEQAAEDLMKDMGMTAQDLEQGAEDINHLQEQQMSQQEKEELRQRLQELRQLLRQQGSGGQSQVLRLQRFGRIARGQSGQGGQGSGGQGSQSQGQSGSEQLGGSQPPGGSGPGQGGSGGTPQQTGSGGETWIVGPNGEKLMMLSRGSGGHGDSSGEGGGGRGQAGRWGEGHDPRVQGKPTSSAMGTQDTDVQGTDTAQGGSRSQAIEGAAERGFVSRNYQKVYTEYHQVAEESLVKDDIPGGYRFYIKRYFQLIRPRDTP